MLDDSIPSFLGQESPENPPLGNIARIASTISPSGQTPVEPLPSISGRVFRYALQSEARVLLPGERVAQCARRVIPGAGFVEVRGLPGSSYYQNLVRCGSVWHDPVCSAKITEGRRVELTQVLAAAGVFTALLTLTLRHSPLDQLEALLAVLINACRQGLFMGRFGVDLRARYHVLGMIRALETTYGLSGWHPHIHYLLLFSEPLDAAGLAALLDELRARWLHVLARRGYDASWEHGVDLQNADSKVRDYITKFGHEPLVTPWTVEHELVKAPVKRAAAGGRSPFQLLADSYAGDEQAGRLFTEYARVFKGRHQLEYSKGLRALLGLGVEKPDEQLAADDDPLAPILARLTRANWARVLGNDIRAETLDVAAKGDPVLLAEFLAGFGVYVEVAK